MEHWGGRRWSDSFDVIIIGNLSQNEELNPSLLEGSAHIFNHSPSFPSSAVEFFVVCEGMALGTVLLAEDLSPYRDISWVIHQVCLMTTCSHQLLLGKPSTWVKLYFLMGVGNVDTGDSRLCHHLGDNDNHDCNSNNNRNWGGSR